MKRHHYLLITAVSLSALGTGWIWLKTTARQSLSANKQERRHSEPRARRESRTAQEYHPPAHLLPLVQNPRMRPDPRLLARLADADKDYLVHLYQQQTNLLDKAASTWALAYVGNADVVDMFTRALSTDYMGHALTAGYGEGSDEEMVLVETVTALGLLAQKHDSAFAFLKSGTDPQFWKATVQWSSSREEHTHGLLTAVSISSIGLSGRSEALQILQKLKEGPLVVRTGSKTGRNISGDIVQAAHYAYLARDGSYGLEYLREFLLAPEVRADAWQRWAISEDGRTWMRWYDEVSHLR